MTTILQRFYVCFMWSICLAQVVIRRSETHSYMYLTDLVCRHDNLTIRPPSGGQIYICDIIYLPSCYTPSMSEQTTVLESRIPDWLQHCQLAKECILYNFGRLEGNMSFAVRYCAIPETGLSKDPAFDICDEKPIVNQKSGFIKSPGYPSTYLNNLRCTKEIRIPPGHRLLLFAEDFQLEGRGILGLFFRKPNDYIQINGGPYLSGDLSGKVLYDSRRTNTSIFFKSDHANTWRSYRGFNIHFFVIPPSQSQWRQQIEQWAKRETGLALHALHGIQPEVDDLRGHKFNLVVLLVSISIVSLLLIVFVYIKHWRMVRSVKRSLRHTVNELVGYVTAGEGWQHGNRSDPRGKSPTTTALLITEDMSPYSKPPLGKLSSQPPYEYVLNRDPQSDAGIRGTSERQVTNDQPPSYEDISTEKKEKK